MTSIEIGRLLRANTSGCVMACKVPSDHLPAFGQMVRIPMDDGTKIFGLIYETTIQDDGLVRQLAIGPHVSDEVIEDNRKNRNMPLEISVSFVGWSAENHTYQTRVPRPPLSLNKIFLCSDEELLSFVSSGKFGYLRGLLRDMEIPGADLLTAHLKQVLDTLNHQSPAPEVENALREIIALLKDDYPQLMDVLSAISEIMD